MTNDKPPFIADQGVRLLMADDPRRHLMPEAFRGSRIEPRKLPGSAGERNDPWQPVDRDEVALDRLHDAGSGPIRLHRLVVTSDAGIGKSTLLDWMLYRNHRADSDRMAFGLVLGGPVSAGGQASRWASLAADGPADGDQLLDRVLVPRLCRSLPSWNVADQQRVHRVLQRLRDQGRLVLLFDGLDQASGEGAVGLLHNLLADRRWQKCRIVVSGRPHALQRYWNELFVDPAIGWRYLQADEFTERQQRAYLGQDASGRDRYKRLPAEARKILGVPRVLEYLRRLDDDQWSTIRRPSDVYWLSIRQLVLSGLQNSAEARRLGLLPGQETPDRALDRQFARAMELLGAIAFEMTATMIRREAGAGTVPRPRVADLDWCELVYGNASTPTEIPNFDRITPQRMPRFRRRVISRVTGKPFQDVSQQDQRLLEQDLDCLAAMNDVLSQGFLDGARTSGGGLSQVLWRNRTLQEFLTAHWLANHATRKLGARLWDWIYRPQDPHSAEYYWVWRFLTEMPDDAIGRSKSWVQAIEPLYRPGNGRAEDTKRSTEMIYRSWPRLDTLAEQKEPTALRVRSAFLGEFEQIRAGRWEHNAEEGQRRAEEFIASFLEIPAGRYRMGAPPEREQIRKKKTPEDPYPEPILSAFLLSHSPTINAWYWLFDPGHGTQIPCYWDYSESDEHPVIYVSWYDGWTFCLWAHWDGLSCQLPREHQWEYAAIANTPYNGGYGFSAELVGTELEDVQWVGDGGGKIDPEWMGGATTVPTCDRADRLGLRDMFGNVWQWCLNGYEDRYAATPPEGNSSRVVRGCHPNDDVYTDFTTEPWIFDMNLSFRVARALRKS